MNRFALPSALRHARPPAHATARSYRGGARAAEVSYRVPRASGVENESNMAFSGLHQLLYLVPELSSLLNSHDGATEFATAPVAAGASVPITAIVPTRLLAYWDEGWKDEAGEYTLRAGTSVDTLPFAATIHLAA
jgi:hypothetical protein